MKSDKEFLHAVYMEAKEKEKIHKRYAYKAALIIFAIGTISVLEVEGSVLIKDEENSRRVTLQVKKCKTEALPSVIECEADDAIFEELYEGEEGIFQLENRKGSYQIIGKE